MSSKAAAAAADRLKVRFRVSIAKGCRNKPTGARRENGAPPWETPRVHPVFQALAAATLAAGDLAAGQGAGGG
ncbi:MAG: hypothetical protein ACXWU6_16105, partial [Allosphingosinicella sp.]